MLRYRFAVVFLLLLLSACQPVSAAPAVSSPSPLVRAAYTSTAAPMKFTATLLPSQTPTVLPSQTPSRTPSPLPPTATFTPSQPPITTLLFTGIIVPSRCVQAALDANSNPDYPYEEVSEIITKADIAVGTFNSTMSDRVEHTGCVWTYQLVGSPSNADAMQRAGFDVMSVATNHIKDCGLMKSWCNETFFDTLDNLRRVSILPVGAGKDLAEALQPVVVTVNGIRFGFVSLGDSKLNEVVFATQDQPGIAFLSEENMRAAIEAARQVADVVIAVPHWGSEDNLLPNWWQREQALYTVAAGADLVVGNHTHVIQAFQQIEGVPVFYGLGNFVFDQGLRDHRQSVILLVRFEGARYLDYQLIPVHTDADGRAHIANPEEAAEILQRIEQASQQLH